MTTAVERHKGQWGHQYVVRGNVVAISFTEETSTVLCLLNREKIKFDKGSKRNGKFLRYRFAKIIVKDNWEGSIFKGFEVSVEDKIAKIGFVLAEIISEEAIETILDPDNPFDRALIDMGAIDEMGLGLFED